MNLYEIQNEIQYLMNLVDDNGELPEEVFDQLEKLDIAETVKIENIGLLIKNLTAESVALKTESDALDKRRKTAENSIESLKAYLVGYLTTSGCPKLSTARVVLSIRPSVGVVVDDESQLPGNYFKYKKELSKSTIKADIEAGIAVPGARLETRQNLQVK
jgi:hypothetical protein